ncbi:ClcR [Nocardioides sp. PD653]|nr:ClcR [Nocardioides sp. PD653-B2]GAW53739.1 ClcR [Nocardioides sp. PD653]
MTVLDARQLECFVAVAEELNLRRAAERLHMSQPPLTRRIRRLESDLQMELFRRTAGGMQLTEPGKVLLERAYRMIALSHRAVERAQQARSGELGRLDIAYYDSAILDGVTALLRDFTAQHPDVKIRLEQIFKRTQIDYIRNKILHLAFGRNYPMESAIETRIVDHEECYLTVPVGQAMNWPDQVDVDSLANQPLILFPQDRSEFADHIVHMCLSAGFPPTVAVEAFDVVSALAYVAIGMGVAVVPRSATKTRSGDIAFIPLIGAPTIALSCAYLSEGRTPATDLFLQFLDVRNSGSV